MIFNWRIKAGNFTYFGQLIVVFAWHITVLVVTVAMEVIGSRNGKKVIVIFIKHEDVPMNATARQSSGKRVKALHFTLF